MKYPVAVITGASSGLGRATALEFAKRGTRVVLASRQKIALAGVADECRRLGVPVLAIATDMTDEAAVQNLARQSFKKFGRVDVWINNAVVGLYGDFERTPARDFRQVIETGFFGYVHGARAVLPIFRRQGRGVLVNVASVLGEFGIPHMSSYVAAKHAVVGFSDSLRQELRGSGIRVCTILPFSIDTPFYANAGNYTGRIVLPIPPVYSPARVAKEIVGAVRDRQDWVFIPPIAHLLAVARSVAPALTEGVANSVTNHFQITPVQMPHSDGNLHAPKPRRRHATAGSKTEHNRLVNWTTPKVIGLGLLGLSLLLRPGASFMSNVAG